jgi:hypothetical protein
MAAGPVIFNRRRIYQSGCKNIGLGENTARRHLNPPALLHCMAGFGIGCPGGAFAPRHSL